MRTWRLLALLLLATPALAELIVGRASMTDGDTLVIGTSKIRLHGIDALDSAQLCKDAAGNGYCYGQATALAPMDRIGAATVSCEPRDTDRYGRTVAVCRKGVEDLDGWLVAQGKAIACWRKARDYVVQEALSQAVP